MTGFGRNEIQMGVRTGEQQDLGQRARWSRRLISGRTERTDLGAVDRSVPGQMLGQPDLYRQNRR